MNKKTLKRAVAIAIPCILLLCLVGCGDEAADVASRYTEETARAIIEAGRKIAVAIFIGHMVSGALSAR